MRILDFYKFSKLYEAEELPTQTDSTLRRIVNSYFMSYGSLGALTQDYVDMLVDLESLKRAKGTDKIEVMREIAKTISGAVMQDFKEKGVHSEWEKAANGFTDSLKALFDQYSSDAEITDAMLVKINNMIEEYKQDLIAAKKQADQTLKQAQAKKESFEFEGEEIFEGWFTGKKANIKNLISQAVSLKANLEGQKASKGLETTVSTLLKEVESIIVKLSTLSTQKRQDIQETELAEIGNRLNEIPLEITKQEEKFAKQDTANKEASSLYLQALDVAENAYRLEMEVKEDLAKKAEEEAAKKKEESRVKLSGDLDPDKISVKAINKEVKKFQELVLKKFSDYEPFKDFELFTKFKRFGADGKFGNTTKQMVVALKGGFGLDDKSDVITQELMDKIVFEPLTESSSPYSFLKSFDNFNKVIEGFSFDKAQSAVVETPAAVKDQDAGTEEQKKDSEGDEDKKDGDKKDVDVAGVTKKVEDMLIGANTALKDLFKDESYWEEFKGSVDDDEDAAVADVFGEKWDQKGTWVDRAVRKKYTIPAYKLLTDSGLKEADKDAYDHLIGELNYLKGKVYKTLREKTYGGTDNDKFTWSFRRVDGSKVKFSVDTDF
jgi:hypothetical protein